MPDRDALQRLLDLLPANRFYSQKLRAAGLEPGRLRYPDDWSRVPLTTKAEIVADQAAEPPFGSIHALPLERYSRFHQTSGTTGRPLRWLDTPESWSGLLDCWEAIFEHIGLRRDDRLFFPFSFGPFLGFWTAWEAACRQGRLCLPGGGMGSTARLRFLLDNDATVVFCTPTYALRLVEVAEEEGVDLHRSKVRAIVVAGEPGGSIPATRQRIESAWGARLFDHHGMTEVGPVTVEPESQPGGLHILDRWYHAEVLDPNTLAPVPPGTAGELVLTNVHRLGSPLVRYRTCDLVRVDPQPGSDLGIGPRLVGGILGRVDDMITIRGNNVYPSAIQTILHRFVEVAEFRLTVEQDGSLPALRIDVELLEDAGEEILARIDQTIRDELLFRAVVRRVAVGTLPRFEMKAQRVVRE
jgi:phenylacetate-CoA ligase